MADYSDPLGLLFGGVDYFGSAQPQQGRGLLQLTPQEIERMAAAQSPAFGVFPQMQPYRSQQDIRASANVPVDVARGRVAGTLGLFGDVFNQPIPMVRPLQLLSQAMTGQQKYPDTEYFLDTLPLKSDTPVGNVAGRVASFAPINPMPAVRGVQKLGGLLGDEIATRVSTGRPILPSLLAEPQTAMFAVNPAEQAMTSGLLQAEVSPLGFYSAVEQQALKIPRKQGTGESFLNDLLKGQDVKKYEIEAMGLDTYLKGKPNVTRQEVQDFIANNRVDVQEVKLGGNLSPELQTTRDSLNDKYRGLVDNIADAKSQFEEGKISYAQLRNTVSNNQVQIQALDTQINEINKTISPTKYGQFQLAGGENYRELLLKLPQKPQPLPENFNVDAYSVNGKTMYGVFDEAGSRYASGETKDQALQKFSQLHQEKPYQSSHFPDPNILAHMRVNDRIDADGKKMLLIEEVQSDWHQAGREQGYNNPKEQALAQEKIRALKAEHKRLGQVKELEPSPLERSIISQQRFDLMNQVNELSKVGNSGIPDAPFKDTWYQLALKRAIKEAVDKGYDRIGLTTGAQQAARYDLSKQVDNLLYSKNPDGTYRVSAQVQGRGQMIGEAIPEAKLSDYVGKEVAEKMSKGTGKQTEVAGEYDPASMTSNKKYMTELSGIDLKVGGEGMKKYYDEIYPNFLNKYGKKYGAQVGETNLTTRKSAYVDYIVGQGNFNDTTVLGVRSDGSTTIINENANSMREAQQLANRYKEKNLKSQKETVRYLDITPEMKKAVQKGQPLAAVEGMTGLLA